MAGRPQLDQWTIPYYTAFCRLSGSRTYTMGGAGPIPLSEILAYCQLHGIRDLDEVDDLIYLIGAIDSEWLKMVGEKK